MVAPPVSVTSNGVVVQVPTPGVVQLAGVAALVRKSGKPRADAKFPLRSNRLGTVATASVMPRVIRRCSSEKKKKVLSLPLHTAGPPSPKRGKVTGPLRVKPKL